jgi:hypothetical protein
MFSHVFSDSLSNEDTHDFSKKVRSPHAMIAHILYHLLDNRHNIIGILTFESGELFYGFFKQFFIEITSGHLMSSMDFEENEIPTDFLINHISSSFVGMVQWWLGNEREQTPEQLSNYFMAVIEPILANKGGSE